MKIFKEDNKEKRKRENKERRRAYIYYGAVPSRIG